VSRPASGVRRGYSSCLPQTHPQHLHIKTIANTRSAERAIDPHHFAYRNAAYAVNENYERVDSPFTKSVSIDKVALYHYVTKSLEDYSQKMARGSAMNNHKTMAFFDTIQELSTENCTDLMSSLIGE
jgi:undecaprenyl pyrophosphate synthase